LSDADKPSKGLNTGSEAKAKSFALEDLTTCSVCLRANPPTRINCLYCLATLPVKAEANKPMGETDKSSALSQLLSAEKPTEVDSLNAYYVVTTKNPKDSVDGLSLAAIAEVLQLQASEVESALKLGGPAPLLRAPAFDLANMLADKLRELGVDVDIFAEETLNLDAPIRKARALEFAEEELIATLLRGGEISMRWDGLVLIVIGRLLVNRKESEERRRHGGSKPKDSRELFLDDPVFDLYAKDDRTGCRVASGSFDFSCLGDRKAMTTFENLTTLIEVLKTRAPNVEIDDSYRNLRAVLANVWPLEPQTTKRDWRRSGVGKVDVSTVTTVDNEIQFNSYSRLRQRVRLSELEGDR
jgi:hypothetical protein